MNSENSHSSPLSQFFKYPLFSAIMNRRSRRISSGLGRIGAGSLTYTTETEVQSLTPLEEAILIAAIGASGLTLPDRPFEQDGAEILGSPNLHMEGRAAGSPDNVQATHFFMLNDSGTYFLRRLAPLPQGTDLTPELLQQRAAQAKVQILDHRLDFPRKFPYYLDSNRFVSNLPGSTVFLPVVDLSVQYINGIMYLLTEEAGHRPVFLDDRNFYRPAGVKKWISNKFLNPEIKIPLGMAGTFRSEIEADLLLQNLMLTLQAMGLGGWIHATVHPPMLLGHPLYSRPDAPEGRGLGFDFATPSFCLWDILRWGVLDPKVRAHPVAYKDLIVSKCPPNFRSMSDAVDSVVSMKYGPSGAYSDRIYFERILKEGFADKYMAEVPKFSEEVIACAKDICDYIYQTHGRFPAHVPAIHVPGVWLQAHHVDTGYYDHLFREGYTTTQRDHQALWHAH